MPQPEEITGTLVSVRWPVADSDFVIGELQPNGTSKRTERIKIVGNCDPPEFELKQVGRGLNSTTVKTPVNDDDSSFQFVLTPQCSYQFYGFRDNDAKWGPQFRFKSFVPVRPHTQAGVVKYLQQCDGIGIAIARALWNKFRGDAVRILREQPEIAASAVSGLTAAKAAVAAEKLETLEKLEDCSIELMGLLDGRGMPKAVAMKALKKWGNRAVDMIKENPFLLLAFKGCGVLSCDAMWSDLGLPHDSPERLMWIAWYSVIDRSNGSTWLTGSEVESYVSGKCGTY